MIYFILFVIIILLIIHFIRGNPNNVRVYNNSMMTSSSSYYSTPSRESSVMRRGDIGTMKRKMFKDEENGRYGRRLGSYFNLRSECSLNQRQGIEIFAMDCEMAEGLMNGKYYSIPVQVCLVNSYGKCIYDRYIKPIMKVSDCRTRYHGISPEDICLFGQDLSDVQRCICTILFRSILVGHDLRNDFKALKISHPPEFTRDTYLFSKFRREVPRCSLKNLAQHYLGVSIQQEFHDCEEDAKAAMALYLKYRSEWELEF